MLGHEQPSRSLFRLSMSAASWGWAMRDDPAELCLYAGLLSHSAKHFEELGVNALSPHTHFFFYSPPPTFLSQQPTGSKRPFAVVKATPYHKDGTIKWQQPRALLPISAASLSRPRCHCQPCCWAQARPILQESDECSHPACLALDPCSQWAGGDVGPAPHGPCPAACMLQASALPRCIPPSTVTPH